MPRVLITLLIAALATSPLPAARLFDTIAFGQSDEGQVGAGSSSLTFTSNATAGTNTIGFLAVSTGNNSPTATQNGNAMTQIGTTNLGGYYVYLFCIVAPSTGAVNVVVTLGSGTNGILGEWADYTGAAQTCAVDSSNTGTLEASTNLTVSTTTVADNAWLVGAFTGSPNVEPSAGASTTAREVQSHTLPIQGGIFDSNAAKTPAGSYSLAVAPGATSFQSMVVASFAPASGGGGGSFPAAILNNPIQCCDPLGVLWFIVSSR